MPIAKLEFNLPEEQSEFNLANMASKLYCCLWEVNQELRSFLKYGHKFKSADDLAEYLRDKILDEVNFDEIG